MSALLATAHGADLSVIFVIIAILFMLGGLYIGVQLQNWFGAAIAVVLGLIILIVAYS